MGWKRIERRAAAIDAADTPPCPRCLEPTDSLKQYRCPSWVVFLLVHAVWQTEYVRACPRCMRSHLARRALWNILPANLLWPLLVLPWTAGLFAATYRKGHSPAVISGFLPADQAAAVVAEQDVSWGRVWAVVAVLFCWAPLVGAVLAALAYFANRRAGGWKRTASLAAVGVSVLVHLLLVGLVVWDVLGRR